MKIEVRASLHIFEKFWAKVEFSKVLAGQIRNFKTKGVVLDILEIRGEEIGNFEKKYQKAPNSELPCGPT